MEMVQNLHGNPISSSPKAAPPFGGSCLVS